MKNTDSARIRRAVKARTHFIRMILVLAVVASVTVPAFGQSDPYANFRRKWAEQQRQQEEYRRQREIEAQRRELDDLRDQQRREINRQRKELDEQQRQIDEITRENRDAALAVQRQQRSSAIAASIASLEAATRLGNPLSDEQINWIKAAGAHGKAYPESEFRPYVQRLYALYFAEKARRGK